MPRSTIECLVVFLLVGVIGIFATMIGCGPQTVPSSNSRIQCIEKATRYGEPDTYIYKDTKTGVEFLVVKDRNGLAITPLPQESW